MHSQSALYALMRGRADREKVRPEATHPMDFRILGPVEASANGEPIALGGPKQRALLAILLLNADRVVSSDRLIEALWAGEPPGAARHAVEVNVSRLRKALGTGVSALVTRAPGYVLEIEPEALDLQRFERLLAEGRRARAAGDAELAARALRDAQDQWRGRPLADLEFEPFARAEIERLHELQLVALEERVEADLALGQSGELVAELTRLTREHPWRERLHAQLMLALYRSGRQADALEAYRQAREVLVAQLGIEPGAELAAPSPGDARPRSGPRRPERRWSGGPARCPRRRTGRSAATTSSRCSLSGCVRARCGCSPSPDPAGWARRASRSRRRAPSRRISPTARTSCRSPPSRDRRTSPRRSPSRSRSSRSRANPPSRRSSASSPPSTCCWSSTTASTCRAPPRSSAGCPRRVQR